MKSGGVVQSDDMIFNGIRVFFFFEAVPGSMNQWDLGSLTKDLSNLCPMALEAQSLNHWTTREVPGNQG